MIGAFHHALGAFALGASGAGKSNELMDIETDPFASTPTGFEKLSEAILMGAIDIGIVAICIGLGLCIWRMVKGPTLIDRGVAVDAFALQVVGLVLLLTVRLGSLVDFDAVLIVAILGFVSTVAFAQYVGRRGAAT